MLRSALPLVALLTLAACGGSGGAMPGGGGAQVNRGPTFESLNAEAERLFDKQAATTLSGERTIQRRGSATFDGVFYGRVGNRQRTFDFVRAETRLDVEFDGKEPRLRGRMTNFVGEESGRLPGTLRIRATRADVGPTADTRVGGHITYQTELSGDLTSPVSGDKRPIDATVLGVFRDDRGNIVTGNVFDRQGRLRLNGSFITER